MEYYETLGVPKTATVEDIRKAYKRLARKYHPDLNPGDKSAEEHFKKVTAAYDAQVAGGLSLALGVTTADRFVSAMYAELMANT